jgi:mannose-6-phosphate isomerase-like protein (cupin superfamily)
MSGIKIYRKDAEIWQKKIFTKKWGYELWIHNDEQYCGKILHFNEGAKFSMHFHIIKNETWYVSKGKLLLKAINPINADRAEVELNVGDIIEIPKGSPHQLIAIEESDVFEISSQHHEFDSYRIEKGDSQE